MRDTLELALTGIVNPDQLAVLCDAVELLDENGLSAPSDELQTIIEIQDAMSDNPTLVSRIYDTLYIAYEEAFTSFGVKVNADADLAFKVGLLTSLTRLDYYIIPEQIQMLYQAPFTNEEIVAHLLPIFTEFDLERSVDLIDEVSDATIARLVTIIEAKVALKDPDDLMSPRDNTARIARLNTVIKAAGKDNVSVVYELAQAGVRAGRPLSALVAQNFEALENAPPEQLACELLALVLFSDTPLDALRVKTQALVNEFEENLNNLRLMDITLNKLYPSLEA